MNKGDVKQMINFKKLASLVLSVCVFGGSFNVFAMEGSSPDEIGSIIKTTEDEEKIRCELNKSVERRHFPTITGGGRRIFKPYEFHGDEPRLIKVYTIPYLLDPDFPVLEELKDMLWSSVSVAEGKEDIGSGYIDGLQHLVNGFRQRYGDAEFMDVGLAIEWFLTECAERDKRLSGAGVKIAKDASENFITKFRSALAKYNMPDKVSDNARGLELMLSLLRCIDNEEYLDKKRGGFCNVFLMAYDTEADSRGFFGRLFGGKRPPIESCVAFTSVSGLDSRTTKGQATFGERYSKLHDELVGAVNKFFDYCQAIKPTPPAPLPDMPSIISYILKRLDEMDIRMDDFDTRLTLLEEFVKPLREGTGRLNELVDAVCAFNDFVSKISSDGKFDSEAFRSMLERVAASTACFDVPQKDDASAKEDSGALGAKIKRLREHVRELKGHVADHADAINDLRESRDSMLELYNDLISCKKAWEERAAEIEEFAKDMNRRDELSKEKQKAACKLFVIDQYNNSGRFGKWLLRRQYPFLKEAKL